jgi:hypothetical protein
VEGGIGKKIQNYKAYNFFLKKLKTPMYNVSHIEDFNMLAYMQKIKKLKDKLKLKLKNTNWKLRRSENY